MKISSFLFSTLLGSVAANMADVPVSMVTKKLPGRNLQTEYGTFVATDQTCADVGSNDVCTLTGEVNFQAGSVTLALEATCPDGWATNDETVAACSSCKALVEDATCNSCTICSDENLAYDCRNVLSPQFTQAGRDCDGNSVGAGQGGTTTSSSPPEKKKASLAIAVLAATFVASLI